MQKLAPYLSTLAVVAIVGSLKFLLNKMLGIDSPLLLFFTGVTLCAWRGGLRQGLWAYVFSVIFIFSFFINPGELLNPVWLTRFLFFTLDCLVVVFICSRLHRSYQQLHSVYKSLELNEKSLRQIFESNMIGLVFSNFQGELTEANDYFLNLLKVSRRDLLERKLRWQDFTPPEYLARSQQALEALKINAPVVPFEKQYLRSDGSRVTVVAGVAKVNESRVVAFMLDISDRKAAEESLATLNNNLEASVELRTQQLTAMNEELTKLVRESIDAEEKLRQSQNFLDSVIENIPNMIFVKNAQDLKFVRFNKAGSQLLGHAQAELLGKNDYDFFPKDQADFFTAKDRLVIDGADVVDIPEEPVETPRGTRLLHTKKIPIFDKDGKPLYLLGISEDITDKKHAEQQRLELLHEQSARWEAEKSAARLTFLSDASDALNKSLEIPVMVSDFLRVINQNFAQWCAIDLVDPKRAEVQHSERTFNLDEECLTRTLPLDDFPLVKRVVTDGKAIITQTRVTLPLGLKDETFGALSIIAPPGHMFDPLEVSMALDLSRRAAIAIENAMLFLKAQDASRTKSAFLANMSHEIRTPLGAMLGFAELSLDDETLTKEQVERLSTILRNGQQLLRIVDEVLDLSKVESDHIEIENINVTLPKLLAEINLLFSLKAQEKGLEFSITPTGPLPQIIKTDPLRLRQILINMIGNALKFTDQGSVSLEVAYEESGLLKMTVTDTGIGISREQVEKLFRPFVQADQTMTRKYGGTGLGLFLSRRLAILMGGNVVLAKSEVSQGSQFVITIPVAVVQQKALPGDVTTTDKIRWTTKLPESGRVLIVDDALENRVLLNAYLEKMGVTTEQAVNGKEGMEKAQQGDFDVILMDVQMPVMDGFEAVRQLRLSGYKNPIVALTAHAMKGDREKCLSQGFDDYLCKPLSRDSLAQCLMNHMLR